MKKSKITLTDAYLIGLKAKAKKYAVWDRACPGFGVEVTPNKVKCMVVKTSQDGHRDWHTLGHYGVSGVEWTDLVTGEPKSRKWNVEDYRLKAMTLKGQVKQGMDPKAVIQARKAAAMAYRQRYTVNQLADRFIKDHMRVNVQVVEGKTVVTKMAPAPSKTGKPKAIGVRLTTARTYIRIIERFVRPILGEMAVEDVGTDVLDGMLQRISDGTPSQANRVRSLLSAMFRKAERWQKRPLGSNPVTVQDRTAEKSRERYLTDTEIQALGAAMASLEGAEGVSPIRLGVIRLSILTGMRRGEVEGLRQDWIDWEAGTIHIPQHSHKTGDKTESERVVGLSAAAIELLRSIPQVLGNPMVFPGKAAGGGVNIQKTWDKVKTKAGFDYAEADKQVHFHDLRRSYSSLATRMGYSDLWVGALLGHTIKNVTGIYARIGFNDDPLRQALEKIGARMAGLLDGSIDLAKEAEAMEASQKVQA